MFELFDLFFTFFKIGIVTFGGGLTMLPLLERVLVDQKKWTTLDDLLDYYAIAQTTPGIIAVNVSTFVGYKRKGIPGGVSATLGMITPSIIIITFIALFVSNFEQIEVVQKAMKGINAAVCALLTYSVISLVKKNVKTPVTFAIFILSFIAINLFHVHTILITLSAVLTGIIIFFAFKGNGLGLKDNKK